jgi:hypothetical protein
MDFLDLMLGIHLSVSPIRYPMFIGPFLSRHSSREIRYSVAPMMSSRLPAGSYVSVLSVTSQKNPSFASPGKIFVIDDPEIVAPWTRRLLQTADP